MSIIASRQKESFSLFVGFNSEKRSRDINLVIDENISREIIDRLRSDGHTLYKISDYHQGVVDSVVLSIARRRQEVLVTKDTDFGKLVFVDNLPTAGVLLIRLSNAMSPLDQAERVSNVISTYGNALIGAFTVLDSDSVRLRLV